MTHWAKYGRAYLVGFVFFVVQNAIAVNAVFGSLTPEQLAALTCRSALILWSKVAAMAGTVLLAFLNQSGAPKPIPVTVTTTG